MTSCELEVASNYILAECFLPLRRAITIITFLARPNRSTAAHKVKMSQEKVWSRNAVRGSGAQGRVCI